MTGYRQKTSSSTPTKDRGKVLNTTLAHSGMSQETQEIDPAAMAVAVEVMRECRAALMTKFRFLDVALWHMPFQPEPGMPALATDGASACYDPMLTLLRYWNNPNEAVRDYLHLILHCLFRHPFDEKHPDADAWSLACDIMVESLAIDMCGERYRSELDSKREEALKHLQELSGSLAPTKLYRLFEGNAGVSGSQENSALAALFERDSHRKWACMRGDEEGDGDKKQDPAGKNRDVQEDETSSTATAQQGEPSPDDANDTSSSPGDPSSSFGDRGEKAESEEGAEDAEGRDEKGDGGAASGSNGDHSESAGGDGADGEEAGRGDGSSSASGGQKGQARNGMSEPREDEQAWEGIAKQVEIDLASHALSWDEGAGKLSSVLAVSNRQTCDYADFLRKFSVLTEDIKVNDDEFDYLFYTYGLSRYGNMPLVEPLEYQECDRVREFVIAIDTSGSCSGDLVRTFIERTYAILKESESFSSTVNVHIIQCDARIQDDMKITSLQELDEYLRTVTLRGFGGTDFRPVFDYVNELLDKGEFENLRGLIYFTDGLGTFPASKPDYDTAFVFMNDEMATPRVPPWAMKVLLDEDGMSQI